MRQSRGDMWMAVLQALVLHVLLFALMFAGLQWTRHEVPEAARGEVIEADLASASDLDVAMQRALKRAPEVPQPVQPEPQPLPEPVVEPQPEVPAELPPPVPDPAPVEQEKVQRDADTPQVAQVDREQEEKRRKPDQAELDAQDAERRRQSALAEIRRQRELAAQERSMAEQRAMQLADARNPSATPTRPPPGDPDSRSLKSASYQVALMNAILRQWTRPDSVRLGQVCQVLIRQIPGGEVVSVEIASSCPYDELGRRSVEAAILKASPLPYAGFEDVFVRDPVLKFRAEDL